MIWGTDLWELLASSHHILQPTWAPAIWGCGTGAARLGLILVDVTFQISDGLLEGTGG
jgi:hypothetical protein